MQIPNHIKEYLQQRINDVKAGVPGELSRDGKALMVSGSIGYDSYVSPDGDIFMETYDIGDDSPPIRDDSQCAQILTLLAGLRTHPILGELLPVRPDDANTCETCSGEGLIHLGKIEIFCQECCGLGWISPSF